ncbi:hypothetical protein HK096_009642 [Nowakowskiella sp. JEL0078]|nr:hypothetical protein HK096_009642 [Nowakowskiella sp. JEL0078]
MSNIGTSSQEEEDNGLSGLITQVKPPTEEETANIKKRPKIEVNLSAVQQINETQTPIVSQRSGRLTRGWRNFMASFTSCYTCSQVREVDAEKSSDLTASLSSQDVVSKKDGVSSPQIEKSAPATPVTEKSKLPGSTKMKHASPVALERKWLLPILEQPFIGKKCLVLDLDETLVHSSFKPVAHADYVIPVEIENQVHNVYVLKRPGVDTFLQRLGAQFEIVVFTASLAKYADPVLDILDKYKVVKHRLFRESCIHHKGNYVKDLSQLGRELKDVIIIDNSPASYIFHPTNAIPITSWFHDPNDTELLDLIPFLEDLKMVENVMLVLDSSNDE